MKLTTKLMLAFCAVSGLIVVLLGIFVIPAAKQRMILRERRYATTYLESRVQDTRAWLRLAEELAANNPDLSVDQARRELFDRLKDSFAQYYLYDSGRIFVIDSKGDFVVSSDQVLRGRSVNNKYLFDDGKRGKLVRTIRQSKERVQMYRIEEVDDVGERVDKTLFVSPLAGTDYYACISVNDEDLYWSAELVARSLTLSLIVILLVFFFFFHIFYVRLKGRYDAVVDSALLISRGNYELTIDDPHADEIGVLAGIIDDLARDMREKAQLEHQLRQAQKMELVGTLASGIAHDFNNILGGITSALDLIEDELRNPSGAAGGVDTDLLYSTIRLAMDCATRGRDTVEQMMSFARTSDRKTQITDLNRIADNMAKFCQSSFDKRIQIECETLSWPAAIKADRSQLEQAILNICINARDAMPEGGLLGLRVDEVRGPRPPRDYGAILDTCFRLSVQDTGCGMNEETCQRLFEPFYTTKPSGTGLGLAMAYKIVSEHHGWLEVDSREGVGTCFYLYLPRGGGLPQEEPDPAIEIMQPAAPAKPPASALPMADHRHTIMVVDDEEHMLRLSRDILERLGYEVITCGEGAAAVELFGAHAGEIHLVVLDLLLPRMGGDEVFDRIRALRGDIRVLLISGSKRDPRIADLLARGCDEFLQKPFSMEDLGRVVHDLLHRE